MAATFTLTTGMVYVRGWSGTVTGATLQLTALQFVSGSTVLNTINAQSDGVIQLAPQTPGTLVPIMQFGGTSSSFPALRRNSSTLEVMLADASAYTYIGGKGVAFGSPGSGFMEGTAAGTVKFQNSTATVKLGMQFNTAPTCTSNCGTSPSVAGSDSAGIITMGASGVPASGFVLTFGSTWTSAPSCVVTPALGSMVVGKLPIAVVTSTTTMTVTTNGTAPATSDKYAYQCFGVA